MPSFTSYDKERIQGELLSLHEDPEALKNKAFSEDDL